jgi:Pentapeptide repeats (8 copies)
MIEILNRWTGKVQYRSETATWVVRACEEAVRADANLANADLRYADLADADLRYADLRDADLGGADLASAKEDLYDVLSYAPNEVPGLLSALLEGRVDGSTYEGECACLVGTLGNVNPALRSLIPRDVFRPGHTPANNAFSKYAAEWVEEWMLSNPVTA